MNDFIIFKIKKHGRKNDYDHAGAN